MTLKPFLVLAIAFTFCTAAFAQTTPNVSPATSPQDGSGQIDGVFIASDATAKYMRKTSNLIGLGQGIIVVSVKDPAPAALVLTRLGRIKIKSGTSALIGVTGDVLKVQNLQGPQDGVIVGLRKDLFGPSAEEVVKLNSGQQITASKPAVLPAAAAPTTAVAVPSGTVATSSAAPPAAQPAAQPGSGVAPAQPTSPTPGTPAAQAKPGISPVVVGAAFGGAGVLGCAALISCIDKGIKKDEDRRRYRDMIQQSAFMDAWQDYNRNRNQSSSNGIRSNSDSTNSRQTGSGDKPTNNASTDGTKTGGNANASDPKIDEKSLMEALNGKGQNGDSTGGQSANSKPASVDNTAANKLPDTNNAKSNEEKSLEKELGLDDDKKAPATANGTAAPDKSAEKDSGMEGIKKDASAAADKIDDKALGLSDEKKPSSSTSEKELTDKDLGLDKREPGLDEKSVSTTPDTKAGADDFNGLFSGNPEIEKVASTQSADPAGWFGDAAKAVNEVAEGAPAGVDAGTDAAANLDGLFSSGGAAAEDVLKGADSAVEMPDVAIPDAGALMEGAAD